MFILTAYLVRSSADSAEERAFQINSSFDVLHPFRRRGDATGIELTDFERKVY